MARISSLVLILVVYFLHFDEPVGAEREVLIRDRLVFLLCDQLAAYLYNGTFPEPVKVMPQKYKDIHPGQKTSVKREAPSSGNRFKRQHVEYEVLDLNDELFHRD